MQTRLAVALLIGCFVLTTPLRAGDDLSASLQRLETDVLQGTAKEQAGRMVYARQRARVQVANDESSAAWGRIASVEDWEAFRDPRIAALKKSLGDYPDPPQALQVHVAGVVRGDGYSVDKLVFESRPGLWVTALLYRPAKLRRSAPGIVISHSHHRPKNHGELQDMGATWARAGCYVLTPDHLGHGERGQHPFQSSADYDGEFRVSRQDYYHRYDSGIQLHLAGNSLMGWLAWDLSRCVDLLLMQPQIDPKAICLFGAVAGGGDPAGVAGALDDRITCVAPFNFGGPQPEAGFPLRDDVETTFNYAGGGSWESTRNISYSARHGFLHWVIVGGVIPRKLIYSYEFAWDRPRDPVWKRYEALYKMYDAADQLDYTHGFGSIRIPDKPASHCTHIGKPHRERIHLLLNRWFDTPTTGDVEYQDRKEASDLICMTPSLREKLQPQTLATLLPALVDQQLQNARKRRDKLQGPAYRAALRTDLDRVLGQTAPLTKPQVTSRKTDQTGALRTERIALQTEAEIQTPLVLLSKTVAPKTIVIAFAQQGKDKLLAARADSFAKLLESGAAICLCDLRGTGETRPGSDRGQYSSATGVSSVGLMLGDPLPVQQLRDLRSVATYLRGRADMKETQLALWGDSLADTNSPKTNFDVPRRIDGRPEQSEPQGALLALLGGLYVDDVQSITIRGGLSGFRDVLTHYQSLIPHDVVIPGLLTTADMVDLIAAQAPTPLVVQETVSGKNIRLSRQQADQAFAIATNRYAQAKAAKALKINP